MTTHVLQTLPPLAVGAQQPGTVDPTFGSVLEIPFTDGWTKAVWNTKLARHFYTWPAVGITHFVKDSIKTGKSILDKYMKQMGPANSLYHFIAHFRLVTFLDHVTYFISLKLLLNVK